MGEGLCKGEGEGEGYGYVPSKRVARLSTSMFLVSIRLRR